ncbi:hypothetical protein ACFO5R_20235 [Halosolutus amylolyticus]|uniref:SPW repeat-containing protein n=1 Tax=Halosolutus amylolyticus TaxID=2932267 RepID=A0ABD5PWC3_9EURY|nr:hypothetical protein [Halosolutus amylolyticus]
MDFDRHDGVAVVGFATIVALSRAVDPAPLSAALAGFLLSVAVWRLYDGKPWEALAWLAWVGAAVAPVLPSGDRAYGVLFLGPLLVGLGLLFGSRFDLLPAIWDVDRGTVDER